MVVSILILCLHVGSGGADFCTVGRHVRTSIGSLHRRRRSRRKLCRIIFQLLHYLSHCPLELWVLALYQRSGIVLDFDVGVDTVTVNHPLPLAAGKGKLGYVDRAAIYQRAAIADPDDAAPRTLANQRTQPGLTKHR